MMMGYRTGKVYRKGRGAYCVFQFCSTAVINMVTKSGVERDYLTYFRVIIHH